MLKTFPAFVSIVLTPAAIPLLFSGTAPIIELVFGEKKSPDPMPIMNIQTISSNIGVFALIFIIPSNPAADIKSPAELKPLEPYLSER